MTTRAPAVLKNSMKRQDKIVPEDMMVLIAIPTPRPDRAKRGSSTSSMYLWWQSLCFCTGTDGWKSYQPKLLQKWHTARVRNGTIKKDVRHMFRSSLFFAFLGQTWAQNLCPWHWRLWNIAGFLQSQIRIKDHVILFWTCFGWEAAMYSASSLDMNLRILTTSISPYYNNTLNGKFLRLFFHVRKLK